MLNDERLTKFWVSVTGPRGKDWHLSRFLTLNISVFSLCFNNSVEIITEFFVFFVLFCCKRKWLWRSLPSAPYAGDLAVITRVSSLIETEMFMRSLCCLWVSWTPYKKALLFMLNVYRQEKGSPLLNEERKEWCTVLPCTLSLKTCAAQLKYSYSMFCCFYYNSCSLSPVDKISHLRSQNHPREALQRLHTSSHHKHHAKLKISFSKIKTEVLQVQPHEA